MIEVPVVSGRFVVVGDLQPTSWLELGREDNPEERARIVEEIAREERDFVVTLGDLVFRGDDLAEWVTLDPILASWGRVLPILGNHDYGLFKGRALRAFDARFPELQGRRFYQARAGSLRLVFLDSNRLRMSSRTWDEQVAWYEATLAEAERDPAVSAVLVFAHHPPYTNSTVSPDDLDVRGTFVPVIHRHAKALAMFSGHVHAYERFIRGGKQFVVSGGGGGPRVQLLEKPDRRHVDDVARGPSPRPFHYLRVTMLGARLRCEVIGFHRGEPTHTIDTFELHSTAPTKSPP